MTKEHKYAATLGMILCKFGVTGFQFRQITFATVLMEKHKMDGFRRRFVVPAYSTYGGRYAVLVPRNEGDPLAEAYVENCLKFV